jgi:multiple sugar transport system permease protein
MRPRNQHAEPHNDRAKPRNVRSILRHALLITVAVLFVMPIVWMIAASLRQAGQPPPRSIELIPNPIALGNYARVFDLLPWGRYFLNSLFVVSFAVPITIVVASWAGFAMAQLPDRSRRTLLVFSLGLLMIPFSALWLTRFVLFSAIGLINSHAALIAPALAGTSPLFVLLFYWTFRRVPMELFESARLEGAHAFSIWWRIALPLALPTAAAVGMLAFLFYWSDFMSPLLYLKSQSLYTLPVGLQQLQQLDRTNWPLLMSGAVLMTLPPVFVFLFLQRYFLRDAQWLR